MTTRGRSAAKAAVGWWARRRSPERIDVGLDVWDLARRADGALARHGVSLAELAERFGSPLHVVSAAALDRNASDALAPLRDPTSGPACDVFYSYKTNPVPGVLARLHAHGIGAEVISPYELWLALRLGVPGDRIIYNGPAKSFASLRDAVRAGVAMVNANSPGDAAAVGRAAAAEGRVANLGLRVTLGSTWGGQFGLDAASDAPETTVRAAQRDPHVVLRGLHVHRGYGIRTAGDLEGYVADVLAFCARLHASTGWYPDTIDLGGSLTTATVAGIPARQYRFNRAFATDLLPPDPTGHLTVAAASRLAASLVAAGAAERGVAVPTVVLEPGRALTGDTQLLLTTVHDVKAGGGIPHAVLDAGINVAEPTSGEYHQVFRASGPDARATRSYRLVGPICTPADVLYHHWRLPELSPGDVLAIMDTGAYFVPFSTSFSFPRPAIVLQDGASVEVLRRAETFEDLVARDAATGSDEPA